MDQSKSRAVVVLTQDWLTREVVPTAVVSLLIWAGLLALLDVAADPPLRTAETLRDGLFLGAAVIPMTTLVLIGSQQGRWLAPDGRDEALPLLDSDCRLTTATRLFGLAIVLAQVALVLPLLALFSVMARSPPLTFVAQVAAMVAPSLCVLALPLVQRQIDWRVAMLTAALGGLLLVLVAREMFAMPDWVGAGLKQIGTALGAFFSIATLEGAFVAGQPHADPCWRSAGLFALLAFAIRLAFPPRPAGSDVAAWSWWKSATRRPSRRLPEGATLLRRRSRRDVTRPLAIVALGMLGLAAAILGGRLLYKWQQAEPIDWATEGLSATLFASAIAAIAIAFTASEHTVHRELTEQTLGPLLLAGVKPIDLLREGFRFPVLAALPAVAAVELSGGLLLALGQSTIGSNAAMVLTPLLAIYVPLVRPIETLTAPAGSFEQTGRGFLVMAFPLWLALLPELRERAVTAIEQRAAE